MFEQKKTSAIVHTYFFVLPFIGFRPILTAVVLDWLCLFRPQAFSLRGPGLLMLNNNCMLYKKHT